MRTITMNHYRWSSFSLFPVSTFMHSACVLIALQVILLSEGLSSQVCRLQDVEKALDPLTQRLRYAYRVAKLQYSDLTANSICSSFAQVTIEAELIDLDMNKISSDISVQLERQTDCSSITWECFKHFPWKCVKFLKQAQAVVGG